jgi:hypothetical protein
MPDAEPAEHSDRRAIGGGGDPSDDRLHDQQRATCLQSGRKTAHSLSKCTRFWPDRHRHCRSCGHSYWRRALSSFCAQGQGSHAHGHRLISKQLRGCSLCPSRPGAPSSLPPMDRPTRPISRVKGMRRSALSRELPKVCRKAALPSRNLMDFKIKLPPAE